MRHLSYHIRALANTLWSTGSLGLPEHLVALRIRCPEPAAAEILFGLGRQRVELGLDPTPEVRPGDARRASGLVWSPAREVARHGPSRNLVTP